MLYRNERLYINKYIEKETEYSSIMYRTIQFIGDIYANDSNWSKLRYT